MTTKTLRLLALAALFASLPCAARAQRPNPLPNPTAAYWNPKLPARARAADLVRQMTLAEKISEMENRAAAIPRLGVPAYNYWSEGLHGVARAGIATVFPQAIGLAAMWNAPLQHRIGRVIATEARAKHNRDVRRGIYSRYHGLTFWAPNINLVRDPRWGRGQETYGEDPYLTGHLAVAYVRGMQGDNPHYLEVVATPKHFALYSGPEPLRHSMSSHGTPRDLRWTYLAAFRQVIEQGRADSVMCSYNAVNGIPSCADAFLLRTHLRQDWGFGGFVVSDCGAIANIAFGHHYTATVPQADADAVKAGTDLSCGRAYTQLGAAVRQGLISVAAINRAVTRLFTARFRLGMFDPPAMVPYDHIPFSQVDSPAHRRLALQAAEEGIVLLKNQGGLLPLSPSVRSIAVIGPAANFPDELLGNYYGIPSRLITPLAALERQFPGKVHFAQGSLYTAFSPAMIPPQALPGGVRGQFFASSSFSGSPAVTQRLPQLYFRWDMRNPAVVARIPRAAFAARWTATLRPRFTGVYQLGLTRLHCDRCAGHDLARLYVNGRLLVTNSQPRISQRTTVYAPLRLVAGRTYRLRVDYLQEGGGAGLELVWQPPAAGLLQRAVAVARRSQVVALFVGLNSNLEGEEMPLKIPGFNGGDRTTLRLPALQRKLVRAILATGKPVVVVLCSGSAVALNQAAAQAPALLEAWYGGEYGGTAIARVLAGAYNPGGHLPITFYRSVKQLPPFTDYSMNGRTYRYFKGRPLFPFGYGLSYTTFQFSAPRVRQTAPGVYRVSATVANTGRRGGDVVAQLYVHDSAAPDQAMRNLRGFRRLSLAAGQRQRIAFTFRASSLGLATPLRSPLRFSIGDGQPLTAWPGVSYAQVSVPAGT
ncbi:MAG: glycoside hydrolase family 3 C-terminal domain-containing protein [Terriglobales bacterium]